MTAVTHRAHPGTPYGGAAVGSPGYSGSLQTANGARAVQVNLVVPARLDKGSDLLEGYRSLCLVKNGILATPDKRFADVVVEYRRTGKITLSPQDPKFYEDVIKNCGAITRVMVANPVQWKELNARVDSQGQWEYKAL